jgi:hypothetical protein
LHTSGRDRTRPISSKADAFRNASIVPVIEAGSSDLKTLDPSLQVGELCCKLLVTDSLAVVQTGHAGAGQIVGQEIGI